MVGGKEWQGSLAQELSQAQSIINLTTGHWITTYALPFIFFAGVGQ